MLRAHGAGCCAQLQGCQGRAELSFPPKPTQAPGMSPQTLGEALSPSAWGQGHFQRHFSKANAPRTPLSLAVVSSFAG